MGLDTVEILMEIERDFGISIPDDRAANSRTVGDTSVMIVEFLIAKGRIPSPELEREVWEGLVTIVSEQMRIKRADIHPESTWVGDITRY
jgi:hypothetical protein